jgi:hypothetical protein
LLANGLNTGIGGTAIDLYYDENSGALQASKDDFLPMGSNDGDIIAYNMGGGAWETFDIGTTGQVLTVATGGGLEWTTLAAGSNTLQEVLDAGSTATSLYLISSPSNAGQEAYMGIVDDAGPYAAKMYAPGGSQVSVTHNGVGITGGTGQTVSIGNSDEGYFISGQV